MKIKKNGKTINLTETEAKKIINKYKINKFINEGIPRLEAKGPKRVILSPKESVPEIGKDIVKYLISKYAGGKSADDIFSAKEDSDFLHKIVQTLHAAVETIEKNSKKSDTDAAKKQLEENKNPKN